MAYDFTEVTERIIHIIIPTDRIHCKYIYLYKRGCQSILSENISKKCFIMSGDKLGSVS
jgi:hypothetical protein